MDSKLIRPQFNISLFNKTVHVIMNQCFVELFQRFINCDPEIQDDWFDVSNGLQIGFEEGEYTDNSPNPEFSVHRFHNALTLCMELEMADSLARLILSAAFDVCRNNPDLDFSAFIAFGRRLETAARGDYAGLHLHAAPLPKKPVSAGYAVSRNYRSQRIG